MCRNILWALPIADVQILEAETVCYIYLDNVALCNEVTEKVVQHFVRAIARKRHMSYIKVLQTIVKPKGTLIRKCQDMIMTEVSSLWSLTLMMSEL